MLELGHILTLGLIAIILGMDAFSIGLGIGIKGLGWKRSVMFAILVGVFHFLLPFFGFLVGQSLSGWLEDVAVMMGGGMLCLLGLQMVWKSIRSGDAEVQEESLTAGGLLLFAISVSIDSLSAGLSLGLFQIDLFFPVVMFGLAGFFLSSIGLSLGRLIGKMAGNYGEVIGGVILIALGMKFIW